MCRNTEKIPVIKKTDVLVIGGGPAGIAAAVCAARRGVKVMLCEANGYLGGMATAGQVGPFMTCYDPAMKNQVIKGFFDEFVRRMEQRNGAIHPQNVQAGSSYAAWRIRGHAHVTPFSSEVFKVTAEEMCEEAGVTLLYHSMFQYVNMEHNTIKSAVFATKAGLIAIEASQYIDCTGDGDVACSAGAPFEVGENNNGKPQPASLFFIIDGVDTSLLNAYKATCSDISQMWFMDKVEEARGKGDFPIPRLKVAMYESVDGTYRVNMSRLDGYDFCDPEDITKAEIEGRKQAWIIFKFLKDYIPGCENIRMLQTAPQLGVRESRRIIGNYVLHASDMKKSIRHDDDIFVSGNRFDMHVGNGVVYETTEGDEPYGVPYRVLIPQKVSNLIVAGRCISGDQGCLSAIRVMPPCFAMGQAAGIAASMAYRDSLSPADIDTQELRSILKTEKVVL